MNQSTKYAKGLSILTGSQQPHIIVWFFYFKSQLRLNYYDQLSITTQSIFKLPL
jgi:hypothetical protein